jgi:hypothetical protein
VSSFCPVSRSFPFMFGNEIEVPSSLSQPLPSAGTGSSLPVRITASESAGKHARTVSAGRSGEQALGCDHTGMRTRTRMHRQVRCRPAGISWRGVAKMGRRPRPVPSTSRGSTLTVCSSALHAQRVAHQTCFPFLTPASLHAPCDSGKRDVRCWMETHLL